LATPAVDVAMPARQACRAATLGNRAAFDDRSPAARSDRRSVVAKLIIIDPALIRSTGNDAYGYHNV
jgi:hypothetical protein